MRRMKHLTAAEILIVQQIAEQEMRKRKKIEYSAKLEAERKARVEKFYAEKVIHKPMSEEAKSKRRMQKKRRGW